MAYITATPKPRYFVSMWHGEAGSIATVVDRRTGQGKGQTLSWKHGGNFRTMADMWAEYLNREEAGNA
jgi:hypothetical protein